MSQYRTGFFLFREDGVKKCAVNYYQDAWDPGVTFSYREWWF